MKKLAVIVCGWHYPAYFYEQMVKQKKPEGWEIDYFCVSHRNPKHAIGEKNINKDSDDFYNKLDHFYYNVSGAYVGEYTPIFVHDLEWGV